MKLASILILFCGVALHADIVFDRGLPTININDAAGADRSNVSWAFPSSWGGYNWAVGDDFTLAGSGTYDVTDLRVWIVSDNAPSDLILFLGNDLDAAAVTPSSTTITQVTYAGGATYQGQSGNYIPIYQVDFSLNWLVQGSQTYTFFVGGGNGSYSPFLHSSNAARSGSTQQGADNLLGYLAYDNSDVVQGIGPWDSNGDGWDKSSDVNVQVFAPEPSIITMLGCFAGAFGLLALKKRK